MNRTKAVVHVTRSYAKRFIGDVVREVAPRRCDLPLTTWNLVRRADGRLSLDGVALADLLEREGSPLHVVDAGRLRANARRFTRTPPGSSQGCRVFYSYKTNPVPGVLQFLHRHGLGAEVASEYELWLAQRLGVSPKDIVYNGPSRSAESLGLAVQRGVGLINCNARSEIALLAAAARAAGTRARVGIRVVPPGASNGQFGERIETGEALAAFREALSHPELQVVAMHAHNNGELSTAEGLDTYLTPLLAFSDELRSRLGLELEILDLGGNLACATVSKLSRTARRLALSLGLEPTPRPPSAVLSIEGYVAQVRRRVEAHYAAARRPLPSVFLEPGRAVTSDAQMLLCRVTRVRDTVIDGAVSAVLDAGCNVAEPLSSEIHHVFPLRLRPGAIRRVHRLTGPNCALDDVLYPAWTLPQLLPGDGLAIMDSGAYFVPFSTCFSRPRPGVVLVNEGQVETARRSECFDDLIARDERSLASRPVGEARRVESAQTFEAYETVPA